MGDVARLFEAVASKERHRTPFDRESPDFAVKSSQIQIEMGASHSVVPMLGSISLIRPQGSRRPWRKSLKLPHEPRLLWRGWAATSREAPCEDEGPSSFVMSWRMCPLSERGKGDGIGTDVGTHRPSHPRDGARGPERLVEERPLGVPGSPNKKLMDLFIRYAQKAKLTDVTFHCLRDTYISRLAPHVSTPTLMALARHRDYRTTRRYVQVDGDHLRAAVERLNEESLTLTALACSWLRET